MSLSQLSHRVSRIKALLLSLRHRSPDSVPLQLGGRISLIPLPCRAPLKVPTSPLSEEDPLVHLFSVRGSVFANVYRNFYGIGVCSCNPEVPWKFFQHFGGLFTRDGGGKGGGRVIFRWSLRGESAALVAALLEPVCSRKKAVLSAVNLLRHSGVRRDSVRLLKEKTLEGRENFFPSGTVDSWRAFSELVDCNGHILFDKVRRGLRIRVDHRKEEVIASISSFLQTQGVPLGLLPKVQMKNFNHSSRKSTYVWGIERRSLGRFVLANLLENGLFLKREKALVALEFLSSRRSDFLCLPPSSNHWTTVKLNHAALKISAVLVHTLHQRQRESRKDRGTRAEYDTRLRALKALRLKEEYRTQMSIQRGRCRALLMDGAKRRLF